MLAVVLVGGEGTRLRPLTYERPKPLLPVVERPIIERVVEWLAGHGVDEVVLSLAYQPDAFAAAFPDDHCAGVPLRYAVEPPTGLDTAGAIAFAARSAHLERDEPFVVVNGDVLTDLDLTALLELHHERNAEATIALTPVEDPSAYGVVPTDAEGRVLAFIEKPPREQAPTNLINAGTYVVEGRMLDRIEPGVRVSVERATFPALVADGALFAMASSAYWIDTGTPDRYLQAQLDVLERRRVHAGVPQATEVSPGVHLGPGAVLDGVVTGTAFVAAGARAEAGSTLESGVLGRSSVLRGGAALRRSVLLEGAVVEAGATVDCSVIGPGAVVGAGAVVEACSVVGARAAVPEGARLTGQRLPA